MSTMEHLLMQIFDRKSSIENQLKRQVEYYAESVSYNLLAEGKKPPRWLWSIELGGLGNLDDKGLNRELLVPGILLPLSSHATPSNSGHFTKPDGVCQSNNFMGPAEYAGQMISDKDILNEHKQNKSDRSSGLMKLKGIDDLTESDPYTQFQQNDQEFPLSNKQNKTDSIGKNSAEQNYSSRLTQSRSANEKTDGVEQPCSPNDPFHHDSVDKGRITRSRSAAQSKCPESFDRLSDSSNHVKCTESGERNAVESRTKTRTSNVRLSNTCINGRSDTETGFDKATNVYSSLKLLHDVAPSLPDVFDVVELKKLDFDATVECNFNENSHMSAEKNNEPPPNVATDSKEDMQFLAKDIACCTSEKVNFSENHTPEHQVDVDSTVTEYDAEQIGLKLAEGEHSESHSHPNSGYQNLPQSINTKSSFGSLSDKDDRVEVENVQNEQITTVDSRTLVESNNSASGRSKNDSVVAKSFPNLDKENMESHSNVVPDIEAFSHNLSETSELEITPSEFLNADIGSISSLRNSSSHGREKSFSCKLSNSILPSSDDVFVSLSTPSIVNGSTMNIRETNVIQVENATRSSYLLRSSSGPRVANDSGHCSEGNLKHLGTRKNDNLDDHIQSTTNKKRRLNSSVKSMYHLRSLSSNSKNEVSSEQRCRKFDPHLLQDIETHPHEYENSWPKRKKAHYRSNSILATSPRLVLKPTDCINMGSESMVQSQPSFSAMSNTRPHKTDLKGCSYLIGNNHYVDQTNISSKGCLEDETNFSETTVCAPLEHNSSEMDNTTENLLDAKHSTKVHVHDNDTRPQTFNTTNSLQYDVTMTEYEGFNMISSPVDETILSNSNLSFEGNDRVSLLEQLSDSRNMIDLASCPFTSYKMNNVPIACQSLPDMDQLLKHIKSTINSGIDASFNGRPHSHSMPYSRSTIYQETKKLPLTPPIMKSSQKTISGQSGASSEKHDCNPELVCFRIDENFSIFNEKEHTKEFDPFEEHVSYGDKMELIHKDTLTDDPVKNKNKIELDRNSVQSATKLFACASRTPRYAVNRKSKMDSGNVTKHPVRKAGLSLRNRSFSKPRISGKLSEPSKRHYSMDKVFKPNSIVSKIPSLIPLVHKTPQAAATMKGRKDIKVKALETAEHSKRLEEKRQHEREMRKAAAQLEREKLQQEDRLLGLKQKQKEEEKKKKDAEVVTRKRQREEEKEREQKRRCFGKTSRQDDKMEDMHQPKVAGEKKQRKEKIVEDAKEKLLKKSGVQNNIYQKKPIDTGKVLSKPKESQAAETMVSVNDESRNIQSYELSPYTNSDDEDEETEARRGQKFVPLWARRESLDRVILSKCQLDPVEIFCRKHSFIVNEVLQMPTVRLPAK